MRRLFLHGAAVLAVTYATTGIATAQTTSASTGSNAPVIYTGCLKSGTDLAGGSTLTPGTSTTAPLKLYTIYSPPEHPDGTVNRTKADALAYEAGRHH